MTEHTRQNLIRIGIIAIVHAMLAIGLNPPTMRTIEAKLEEVMTGYTEPLELPGRYSAKTGIINATNLLVEIRRRDHVSPRKTMHTLLTHCWDAVDCTDRSLREPELAWQELKIQPLITACIENPHTLIAIPTGLASRN